MADNRINIVISAKDEGTAVVKQFGNSLDDASTKGSAFRDSLSRIRDVALGVYLPQLGLKLLDLGKNAIDSAGNFEQSRVAFETMLGSAETAQTLLTQISAFAKETPFDLPGVVDASKQLLAYGFAQDQVLPTLRKLGDVAAGVSVPIGQLTAVYGQVRVAGKLMGQDLLQFTQAGVPLLDYLAQTMHKTAADIKKDMEGGVGPTFENVQTALEAMTSEGSKFGGLMDKQSHTFQGVMSNIGDSFGQIGRAALGMDTAGNIVKGSFFDRIKDAATAVMPVLQDFATKVGPAVQDGLDGLITFGGKVEDGIKWVSQYSDQIQTAAIVITTLFAPAIMGAAVTTTVSAATMVGSAFLAKTAWIVAAVQTSASWWIAFAKLVAYGVSTAAKAVVSATITSAAWVGSAVVTSASWLLEMTKVTAAGALVALKATPHAADTALAWTINAARVSFVWVMTELPKIVAGFIVTSVQAGVHAGATATAWILASAKSSFAWVTQELPRIVLGFFTTSGSAVGNAAITASAWVASASQSATAWLITELPRIIAAFVAASASAVASAAIATGAWVAAAVTSSASYAAFAALVATPMVMPAILIVAALASIAAVWVKYQEMMTAIKSGETQLKQSQSATAQLQQKYYDAQKSGDQGAIDKAKKAYFGALDSDIGILTDQGKNHFATGTNSSPGGEAMVGENGPERVRLPQGSEVIPAYRTRAAGGESGGGFQIGNLIINNQMDEQKLLAKIGWKLALR